MEVEDPLLKNGLKSSIFELQSTICLCRGLGPLQTVTRIIYRILSDEKNLSNHLLVSMALPVDFTHYRPDSQ